MSKYGEIRRTAGRGLRPAAVFLVAGVVMGSGYAVSSLEANTEEAATVSSPPVEPVEEMVSPSVEERRAMLLADSDALYNAAVWLARCIYSESGRRHEQELVAWVVRNRVETRYRGRSTYRSVITDPYQFSAFNRGSLSRDFLVSLDSAVTDRGWRQALAVAKKVILAPPQLRPFPVTVRHFYSERSLGDAQIPAWSLEIKPFEIERFEVDERRFRFFDGVS